MTNGNKVKATEQKKDKEDNWKGQGRGQGRAFRCNKIVRQTQGSRCIQGGIGRASNNNE